MTSIADPIFSFYFLLFFAAVIGGIIVEIILNKEQKSKTHNPKRTKRVKFKKLKFKKLKFQMEETTHKVTDRRSGEEVTRGTLEHCKNFRAQAYKPEEHPHLTITGVDEVVEKEQTEKTLPEISEEESQRVDENITTMFEKTDAVIKIQDEMEALMESMTPEQSEHFAARVQKDPRKEKLLSVIAEME